MYLIIVRRISLATFKSFGVIGLEVFVRDLNSLLTNNESSRVYD